MSYLGIVTLKGQQKIAAAIGGTPLSLTTIRVGDGNGSPITPNETMTDLVRRVGTGYAITSAGPDATDPNIWRVTTVIDENQGPFDVREIAVFDAAGDMIALASHPLVEKRSTAQGAAVALTTDIIFAVSETAQVNVTLAQENAAGIADMLRAPFLVVNSATVATPPASPVLGDTYVVPTGATGAWSGYVGYLVQWNSTVWQAANPPLGHFVVALDKGSTSSARYLTKTASGWVPELPRAVQGGSWNYAAAGGTANAASITLDPTPASWNDLIGTPLRVKALAANTGAATLAVAGLSGTKAITRVNAAPLQANDFVAGQIVELIYDGTRVQAVGLNPLVIPSRAAPVLFAAPGASTWVVPAGVYRARIRVWGGGGGGGGSLGTPGAGSGGSAAGYAEGIFDLVPGASHTVTVGAGGGGGSGVPTNGSAGGTSSVGSIISATGGGGGVGGANGIVFSAGAPGTGSGGAISITGYGGGYGQSYGATVGGGFGGGAFGGSIIGPNISAAGLPGFFPGGGGSGGAGGYVGGSGASGLVIIEPI